MVDIDAIADRAEQRVSVGGKRQIALLVDGGAELVELVVQLHFLMLENNENNKYYLKRYSLFSKFDQGIKIDHGIGWLMQRAGTR